MVYAMLLTIASLVAADNAAPPSPPPALQVPSLPTSTMQIPWNEFRGMLDAVEQAKRQLEELRKPKKEPEAPVPYSIAEAEYSAQALERNALQVDLTMKLQVWATDSWVRIPVIGAAVAPVSVSLDGDPVSLLGDREGWLTLLVRSAGEHVFKSTFYTNVASNEGVSSFEFSCAESALTTMSLRIAQKDAIVSATNAANVSSTVTDSALETKLAFPRTSSISVNWTLPAQQAEVQPPPEPRVACNTFTLATVMEDAVSCKSVLRYTVMRGGVDSFAIAIPASASILSVETQASDKNNAATTAWSQTPMPENLTRVDITANHRVEDTYTLEITFEAPYKGELAVIPEVRVLDVVRGTGYVGVAARGNIEIQPSNTIEGYSRLDVGELPTELRSISTNPLLLAFRPGEGSRVLAVDVRRLADVAVPDSSIEVAMLTTLVTDDGMAVTRAVYEVRNSVRQFLRVSLDKSAEVWSTRVSDQVVKPGRDAASGDIVIPLFKSVEVNRRLDSFPVEIVYMQRIAPPKGLKHAAELTAPAVDILAGQVFWEVMLPQTRSLYSSTGDLKPIVQAMLLDSPDRVSRARPRAATKKEHVYRLREGIERFFMSDINNPAASAGGNPERYKGAPLTPEQVGAVPAAATVTGVLPVAIDIPTDGVRYCFERVLVAQGQRLQLALQTTPSWIGRAISVGRDAAVFAVGFALVLMAGRIVLRARRWSVSVLATLLLAVAGIVLQRFAPFALTFCYIGALFALLCLLVPTIQKIRPYLFVRKQATSVAG
ncbi:MAG: hypothetical protein K1Y02_07150 [Candidatus Hydrogenedentes bacterium]|nr:hypothetical protein [Candidatus Hydrogenedentota bacterium]